jgi:hypothetical protein
MSMGGKRKKSHGPSADNQLMLADQPFNKLTTAYGQKASQLSSLYQ